MNPNEALAFLNSQESPLEAPAQKESLSPNEAGQQLAVQPRATGMSKEDALNFLTSGSSQATPRGSDASYLTSPIPAAQEITSDPNNLTSNYIQSVPQATPQATPQASQGMSKEDALAFLGGSLPEQTGKPINLPAINPIDNALRNFANTAATSTLNTVGGAVRYFNNAQQKDLKMAQEELAQAQESGESPEQINEIQGRINRFNEQIPQVQEAVKSITDLSNQYPEAYGVSPEDKSTSAQIGRGLGQVASFMPTMALGPAGAPLGALQGASQAYEGTYQQTLQSLESQGVTDKALMEDKAQREASIAAVKSLPQLATYMVGGKLASAGVSKLLSTQKPLIQGAAGAVAGSIMNTAAGATIRKIMGESVMPTVESLTQDIAFGLFHGVGTGVEAQQKLKFEEQKRKLEEQKLGGPAPKVAPSTNPEVNKKEAEILASADAQAPAPEVVVTDVRATVPDLTSLIEEQLFLKEGSDEWNKIQAQIDELNKPTGESTAPAAKPTEVTPAKEPTPTLPATGGELTANLVESGTSLESFGRDTLSELAEYYGVDVPKDASRGEIIDAINARKPAEATAEAQPKKPNAIQEPSTTETMLRTQGEGQGEVVELPRVGEQNAEVPTKKGKAKPQEITLTEEQQAEKVLLDKIDAEAGKPKAPKAKAPEVNPYEEVLRRYESGEEDSINTPTDLVNEVSKIARKKQNQYLKDAVDRYYEAMDIGADVEPEVQKLLDEVKRESNRYKAPASEKAPKRKTAKDKALDVLGDAANGLSYVLENKILDPITYKRMVKSGIIPKGGGEYDFFYNSKLPRKVRDLIFSRDGSPIDVIAGEMGKTPDELLGEIQEAYIAKEKLDQETKAKEQENKALEEEFKRMEALKNTDPEGYAGKEEEGVRKFLINESRREGGFIEFPDFVKDAAIRVGDSVRKGITSFKEWSAEMVSRLGEGVRNFLKDIWAGVRDNWNKDIGGGFDTGGRSLEMAAEEAKFAPKAPTEQEAFAKKAADAFQRGRGTPITEEEMGNILARKFPGISPSEASDLYATASGKPKAPAPYAGATSKEAPQGETTSLKNATAEAEAKALGFPELTKQDEQEMNVAMDKAKAASEQDPFAGQRLAESLIADPRRSLTGDESALLLKHKTDLFNGLNKLAEGLTEGSPAQKFEKGLAYDNASKAYRDLLQAIKDRGSEWGREGRWRQALLSQDYTFATQERLAAAAKRKPLTSNEKTKLAEETKRLTEIDNEIVETQEKEANKQEQKSVEKELKNASQVDPYIQSLVDRIQKNVSSAADAARERIKQRRKEGRLFTGVDTDNIADYAIIGADHLLEGATKFSDWSSRMISEFGEKIRPYLNDIFNKSKEFNEQQVDKESKGSKSVKKRVAKATSPEERIRKSQETRARNRLEQLKQEEERQNKGDFSKPVKKVPIEPSEETKALRIEAQKIKDRIDKRKADFEKANRPLTNKVLDSISALNRFNILSHLTVLEHLAGAAVENIVTRPVSSTISQVFRFNKTLNSIRKKAIYEGGLSAKSELKGVFGIVTSAKDVVNKLLKGKADIDWLYGGKNNFSPSFVRVVENIHGAMKEPVRQGIFSRSLQLRIDAAEKMGLDPTHDEVLYHTLASEAVNDANMDIFMGDNFITRGIRGLMKGFETNKQSPRLGKFASALMDIAMPVMNVPTNIAIRKMRLAGGLFEAATRIKIASKEGKLANNAETLTNQEAEQIMRAFKYGTLGIAIGAYAWTNANQFGGIISNVGPNAPENKKLKKGEMELGGLKIAKPLGHGPVATYMNMIADARRMYDKSVRNNPNSKWSSLSEPAFFSMFVSGLGSMPPAQAATRFFSPFTTASQKVGQTLRDMIIPGAVQDVAAKMDTTSQPKDFIDMIEAEPIKRSPKTLEQEIMKGIPGLRQQVPASKPRGGSSSKPFYQKSSQTKKSKPFYAK